MTTTQKPVILIVHGAWHRPLHFRPLIDALNAKGFTVLAPPLASSGYDDSIVGKTHHDDLKRIQDAIQLVLEEGREILAIGHSYGAMPLAAAIQGQTVAERASRGLKGGFSSAIFIAPAPYFQAGVSMYEEAGNKWGDGLFYEVTETRLPLIAEAAKEAFYSGIDPAIKDHAYSHVCHQSKEPFRTPVICTPTELDIPKTLVVCTTDKAIPREVQILTAEKWGAKPVEVDAGHSPWLVDSCREQILGLIAQQA